MSNSGGPQYLAIPGPSVMPDRVLRAMHRPAPNIYHGELEEMVAGLVPDLKRVARTDGSVALYISNGHGAWEAAVTNTLSRGDQALALCCGRFGHGWAEVAEKLGVRCQRLDFGRQSAVDAERLEQALAADPDHQIKSVLMTQTDTATSVRADVAAVRAALDRAQHPALLQVDCIASMGCDRFEMDAWGADLAITGSQKGLMTPPGMSFVFFNERADAARGTANLVTPYWDWRPRIEPDALYLYFYGTSPTHHLYGLRAALDMLHEEGIEQVWARHAKLARAIWAAADAWGQEGGLSLNLADPSIRSHAVTSLRLPNGGGKALQDWVEANVGLTLGIGLGMETEADPRGHDAFRIGHMGHLNGHMILGALGGIEAGLTALGIPHGKGALEAAASVVAEA